MFAFFHASGKLHAERDILNSFVKEGTIESPACFNIVGVIRSGPDALFVLIHLIRSDSLN